MVEAQPKPSRARWLVPLLLLGIFMLFSAGLAVLFLFAVLRGEPGVARVLEVELNGGIDEAPDPFDRLFPGLAGPPSLFEMRTAVTRAARDGSIKALRLDIQNLGIGWAQAEEIVSLCEEFRANGKPVIAYLRGDIVSDLDYLVALGADEIWAAPGTAVTVNGLSAEVEFWKGTLDKLHVEPQYLMLKEYKSAGEPMSRREMSSFFRESLTAVLSDMFDRLVAVAEARRGIEPESFRAAASLGLMTASEALGARWLDQLGYDDQVRARVVERGGLGRYRSTSVSSYASRASRSGFLAGRRRIAVVMGSGAIVAATREALFDSDTLSGPAVALNIERAARDSNVAAIVFRVNSPGGSPVGSDHVWRAIQEARERWSKPVVVSMSTLAGSGGYWVATGADAIVAEPTTITGSIGVVFGKLNVSGLYELVGAHVDTVQVGENANLLSTVHSLDDRQRERILTWMNQTYDDFKQRVATGRKLDPVKVEEVARGRIWSGTDARDLGLVDELGGYREAIAVARSKAGIAADQEVEVVLYPRVPSLFEILFAEGVEDRVRQLLWRGTGVPRLPRGLEELTRPGIWLLAPRFEIR